MGFTLINPFAISSAPTDPNWASVTLLIQGQSDMTDKSSLGLTVTANNGAALSSAQAKWGSQSIYLDGTNDYLSVSSTTAFDFGTGDYTIEGWFRRDGAQGVNARLFGDSAANIMSAYLSGSSSLVYNSQSTALSGGTLSDATWTHIAWCRSGSTQRVFVNGTQAASGSESGSHDSGGMWVGNCGSLTQYFKGWIQDFRVTKGVARYTAGFSVPTAAFPTS